MFKYIKGLIMKKELLRIQELELENKKLEAENEKMNSDMLDMFMEIQCMEIQMEELNEPTEEYEKCSCGGEMLPMYEEHPNWITFCKRCDTRDTDSTYSPISEPA